MDRRSGVEIKKAEGKYNRLCRQTLQIPWYVRNKDFQTELNIPPLTIRISQARERMIDRLTQHQLEDRKEVGQLLEDAPPQPFML